VDGGPDGVPRHWILDALGAICLVRALGVGREAIEAGLRDFALGEHRLTPVRNVGGVTYIDDSKATNPHAAEAAFAGFGPGSVVWIAGGAAKGTAMEDLVAGIVGTLRGVVVIGKDTEAIDNALGRHARGLPVVRVADRETGGVMTRAVRAAQGLAGGRGVVLLAPAAASTDQFASYAERGDAFARAVWDLPEGADRPEGGHGEGEA
jgi:UDP-N-acetylmuramoylalanine--D-glutamate ligase